jgi:hypothetical protein
MTSSFKIGLTEGGMTALDALTTPLPDPQWDFQQYRRMDRQGDMALKGRGPRTIIWKFPLLEVEQISQLEDFQSLDPIYIQSLKRDDEIGIFEVQPNWIDPRQDGEHQAGFRGHRMGLTIEFVVISEVV